MSRKLICDFCSTEFPDHDADVDTSKSNNWVEQLDKATDICAECAMLMVHNMIDHGGYNMATLYSMRDGRFPEPAVKLCTDDGEDLDFDPEDLRPNPEVAAIQEKFDESLHQKLDAAVKQLFDPDPDATADTVFHLSMHGAGLNPQHELLFQTLDEAKDYAVKNAQVFPEAAYYLQCPDGTCLQGDSNVAWTNPHAPLDPSEVRVNWKVKSQPKKA